MAGQERVKPQKIGRQAAFGSQSLDDFAIFFGFVFYFGYRILGSNLMEHDVLLLVSNRD